MTKKQTKSTTRSFTDLLGQPQTLGRLICQILGALFLGWFAYTKWGTSGSSIMYVAGFAVLGMGLGAAVYYLTSDLWDLFLPTIPEIEEP